MRRGIALGLTVMLAATLLIANAQAKWSVARESGMQGDVADIQFIDQTHGWILLAQGEVRYTTDGGKTWIPLFSGISEPINAIYFADEKHGWAGGFGGIIATSDGGESWHQEQIGTSDPIWGVYFRNKKTGWAVGTNGLILQTVDGGKTWMRVNVGIKRAWLYDLCSPDGRTLWAVGSLGLIMRYGS